MGTSFYGDRPYRGPDETQLKCLTLVADGMSMSEVADHLSMRPHDVCASLRGLRTSMGVRSLSHAVGKAIREKLI